MGEKVIENGEDRFLDLAGVTGPADDDHPFGEIYDDEGFGIGAVIGGNGVGVGHVDDGEGRFVGMELLGGRTDEHVAGKEGVPGFFADDPHRQAVRRPRPGEAILDEQIPAVHVGGHPLVETVEISRVEGAVHVTPVDEIVAGRFVDDEFLAGRPAGIVAGLDGNCSQVGDEPFPSLDLSLIHI